MHFDYTVYSVGKEGILLVPDNIVMNVSMTKKTLEKTINTERKITRA